MKEISAKFKLYILSFALMLNHMHLLIKFKEANMSIYMKNLFERYAKYFNKKYARVGTLFQGRYKQILVNDSIHFLYLPFYIHFNPLDLSYPEWRENKISNPEKAIQFLKSYRWSSHLDYLGIKNFPSVLNMGLLVDVLGKNEDYKKLVSSYMKDIQIDEEVTLE